MGELRCVRVGRGRHGVGELRIVCGKGRAWSGRVEMCACVCVWEGGGHGVGELRCVHV